jgi:hypothetical protein
MDAPAQAAVRKALLVYVAWVLATYLLEGMPGTLVRPEAVGLRLAYALVANLGIGILLPLWILRGLVRRGWAAPGDFGLSGAARTVPSVLAAAAVGYALFTYSQPDPVHWLVVLNSFAQVWVVSAAEIVVCWALVGATIFVALRARHRWAAIAAAAIAASVLFGVYHFAHSAPFNELRMVAFLTGIGLVTSLWWFASHDVYGTAVFHNFFGVTGVLAALKAGGLVPEQPTLAVPLVATAAVVALAVLIPGTLWLRRRPE